MKEIKLLYIPYAGGSALSCKMWKPYLHANIEIQPVELAGRGSRFKETLYEDMKEVIEDLFCSIQSYTDQPYAIYGHSYGALLTYELYYRILHSGIQKPVHLFFSGCKPPFQRVKETEMHKLPDEKFIQEISLFEGMERALLENRELLDIFLPIIRADFKVIDKYRYQEKPLKINVPVSVLYGNDMNRETVNGWETLTEKEIDFYHINGSHFFIKEKLQDVASVITSKLYYFI